MPSFSIVTAVYNREDTVARCIESLKRQSYAHYQHIIVDDGSTDRTPNVVTESSRADPNLIFLRLEGNHGVNYARNRAIEQASCDFIIILDSDDYFLPNGLQVIANAVEINPEFKHLLFVPSDLEETFKRHPRLRNPSAILQFPDWLEGSIAGDFIHVIHKSCFRNGGFSEDFRIYEKLDLLRIMKENGKQLYINKTVVGRDRDRKDSVTREYYLDNSRSMENYYRYVQRMVTWFHEDYRSHCAMPLAAEIKKGVLLGIALGKYCSNHELLGILQRDGQHALLLRLANGLRLRPLAFLLAWGSSKANQLLRQARSPLARSRRSLR